MPSDADADIDRLYQLPLGEFTAARDALSKTAGDRRSEIKRLEKPSAAAWGVNQLYWRHRKVLDRLTSAFENVRAAQARRIAGGAADLAAAEATHRVALDRAVVGVRDLLVAGGDAASPATMTAVTETLQALPFSSPDGRLVRPLRPVGFAALAGLMGAVPVTALRGADVVAFDRAAAARPSGARPTAAVKQAGAARAAAAKAKAAAREEAKRLVVAERGLREARAAERAAGARAARAAVEADEAASTRDRLRAALEASEDDVRARRASRDRAAAEARAAAAFRQRLDDELDRLKRPGTS